MSIYDWPGWGVSGFELRVLPNTRRFDGPYTPVTQVIDLLGERLQGTITLPPTTNTIEVAAREAFFDRLKGPANLIRLWHLKLTAPQGTARDGSVIGLVNTAGSALNLVNTAGSALTLVSGTPALAADVAQGANTALIQGTPGTTYLPGDPLGIAGQWVRVMAPVTFDGSGQATLEFQPRARAAWAAGTPLVWNRPTFNAMLKGDGVPTQWVPGYGQGASFDFIEVP